MPLFKYVEADRVDVVETCRICFSLPNDLNDPFECLSDTLFLDDPRWRNRSIENAARVALVTGLIKDTYEQRPTGVTLEQLREYGRERHFEDANELKQIVVGGHKEVASCFRVLCLSRVGPVEADGLLLWAHYTKGHRGMVLEFDEDHEWLRPVDREPPERQTRGLVEYRNKRAGTVVTEDGSLAPTRTHFFTKSAGWSYECEYRVLIPANCPDLETTKTGATLVRFSPKALRAVTFGVKTSGEIKERVRKACQQHAMKHVQLRQAEIHPDEFRLQLVPP